jgi:hypothetical protein
MMNNQLIKENIHGEFDVLLDPVTNFCAIKRGDDIGPFFDSWHDCVDWGQDTRCGALSLPGYDIAPLAGLQAIFAQMYINRLAGAA